MSGRILVVDDEEPILELLRDGLQAEGYEVDTALNAMDALALVKASLYDVAILDFALPGMNGIALHNRIRQMDEELAKNTLFISGRQQSDENLSYYESLARGFLPKPFRVSDVVAKIRSLI